MHSSSCFSLSHSLCGWQDVGQRWKSWANEQWTNGEKEIWNAACTWKTMGCLIVPALVHGNLDWMRTGNTSIKCYMISLFSCISPKGELWTVCVINNKWMLQNYFKEKFHELLSPVRVDSWSSLRHFTCSLAKHLK